MMRALFDRLSHPFGEDKRYRIQRTAGMILEKYLPDFASRAEAIELGLKAPGGKDTDFIDLLSRELPPWQKNG